MSKIAFIGLGNMGGPMAANLVKAGHKVDGFDLVRASRDAAKAEWCCDRSQRAGRGEGRRSRHHHAASGQARAVGLERRSCHPIDKGALMIDCSTIDVASAAQAPRAGEPERGSLIDAPVSGGVGGAEGGTLTFMAGGAARRFAAAKPILEEMGKKIVHCGGAGAGQAAKICNNMILGISMIGVGEAFVLAEKLGLRIRHCSTSPPPRRASAGR